MLQLSSLPLPNSTHFPSSPPFNSTPTSRSRFHLRRSMPSPPPPPPDAGEIAHQFRFFNVYKDGRLHMFNPIEKAPPSSPDPLTGILSKDVAIQSQPSVSARIFLPPNPTRKLPLLFHIHGGGFCSESAFSPAMKQYLTVLAATSESIILSVEYGLFPDRPIPACYEDSWAGLEWVASHGSGDGPDLWLNRYADLTRVFLCGDSAGGNIAHNLAVRVGSVGLPGLNVVGLVMVHPFFGGTADDEMWLYMCPSNGGLDDPRLKPSLEDLGKVGCKKVLIFVAEKDHLSVVGKNYYEDLKRSDWKGIVEIEETKGEEHCFHILDFGSQNSLALIKSFASYIRNN